VAADLIREGVTGMAAHVEEPYLDGTVRPQVLFPAYVSGMNLAESFYLAMPFLGWQNIIVGDPLCAPFRAATLAPEEIAEDVDPETELPALFAERVLALTAEQAPDEDLNLEATKLVLRANVRAGRDDTEGAEEFLRQAIELEPRLTVASMQLASYYEAREAYDLAIEEYERILTVDPENVVVLNNLAFALAVRKESPEEALPLAKKAYETTPAPVIADTLGWIHHLLGNKEAAARLLAQAAAGARNNAEIQWHAAFAYAAVDDLARARATLEAALTLDPTLADRDDIKELRERIGGSDSRT
jgi:tetratricopeptide (TPR) repeat protein